MSFFAITRQYSDNGWVMLTKRIIEIFLISNYHPSRVNGVVVAVEAAVLWLKVTTNNVITNDYELLYGDSYSLEATTLVFATSSSLLLRPVDFVVNTHDNCSGRRTRRFSVILMVSIL